MELIKKDIIKFKSKFVTGQAEECWLWKGPLDKVGRGKIRIRGKGERPHRIAYFLHYKIDPGKLCVCHSCDVPACVNPYHLWLGTLADNNKDRSKKGRTRTGDQRGEKCGTHKLTEKEVLKIRKLYPKISQSKIAKQFGVCQMTISNIVRRAKWAHI